MLKIKLQVFFNENDIDNLSFKIEQWFSKFNNKTTKAEEEKL